MAFAELYRPHSRAIELAGRRCRISVDQLAWLEHLDRACGRYRVDPAAPEGTCAGKATADRAPAELHLLGPAEHLPASARALLGLRAAVELDPARPWVGSVAGRTVSVEPRKLLLVAAELGVCLIRQPVSSMASFYYNYLHPLVVEWLARSGVLYVHAGAIEHPLAGPILVAGPRHAGKTTTCLALLVAGGCRLLSDDTVLVDERGRLHTLLRPLHPERRLCEAWSSHLARCGIDIDRLEPLEGDRLDLDPAVWFADRLVDRLEPPRALVLPWADPGCDRPTRAEPVGPEQAAAVLLAQIHAGAPPFDRALLARIADLIALPALRLHVGRDAMGDPRVVERELARGLEAIAP